MNDAVQRPVAARGPALLAAIAALLVVFAFDRHWLDFELVRRAELLWLCGLACVLFPAVLHAPTRAGWCVLALAAWHGIAALAAGSELVATEALARLGHLLAFFLLLQFARLGSFRQWSAGIGTFTALGVALGLWQALGFGIPGGYDDAASPVSLFGNANVASEATAMGLAVVALRAATGSLWWHVLLAAGSAYLVCNGSRSGMVALPLAVAWIACTCGTSALRRTGLVAALCIGFALGWFVDRPAAAAPAATPAGTATAAAPSTLEVRAEIARGALALAAEAPLLGHGPGQFQVQYPLVRTQREVELSSFGRRFRTEVRTAHDDWLELLAEGGIPALLLALAAFGCLARDLWRNDRPRTAVVLAFAALMLVRSPLGNAVALAVFALAAGSLASPLPAARTGAVRRIAALVTGLALLALALPTLRGQRAFVGYQQSVAAGAARDLQALRDAAAANATEPRFQHLLAQELAPTDPAAARAALERALVLRPHEPALHLLAAEFAVQDGRDGIARNHALAVLRSDPGDPEARVLLSALYFRAGNPDGAARIVWEDPHPRLRERLADHFRELQQLADARGAVADAARYAAERSFVQALDALTEAEANRKLARARILVEQCRTNFEAAGLLPSDLRPWALGSLLALAAGDVAGAEAVCERANQALVDESGFTWQAAALGSSARELQARVPCWTVVLGARR